MDNTTTAPAQQAVSVSNAATQSVITSTVPVTHSNFSKFMSVLAALEPLILAGVSPFVKNSNSQIIVANEAPIAQTLFEALSQL